MRVSNRVVQNWIRNGCDDIHFFQIGGDPRFYYTKIRPGVKEFLEAVKDMYELHVYTMGTRAYAKEICNIIDPGAHYFSTRILTQDESARIDTKSINLNHLFPRGDDMVVILDDTAAMWDFRPNLIPAAPYDYFQMLDEVNVNVSQMAEAKATTAKLHAAHRRTKYSNQIAFPSDLAHEFTGAGFDQTTGDALAYALCLDARERYEWQSATAIEDMQATCKGLGITQRLCTLIEMWNRDAVATAETARKNDQAPRDPDAHAQDLISQELRAAISLVHAAFRGLHCVFRLLPVKADGQSGGGGAQGAAPTPTAAASSSAASTSGGGGGGGAPKYKRRRPRHRAQQHQQQQQHWAPSAVTSSSSAGGGVGSHRDARERGDESQPPSKQAKHTPAEGTGHGGQDTGTGEREDKQQQQQQQQHHSSAATSAQTLSPPMPAALRTTEARQAAPSPRAPAGCTFELVLFALPIDGDYGEDGAPCHLERLRLHLLRQISCLARIERVDKGGYRIHMGRWIANIVRTLGAKGIEEVLLSRLRCVELTEACLLLRMARQLTPVGPWKDESDDHAVLSRLASKLGGPEWRVQRQPRLRPHEDTDAHLKTVTDICKEICTSFFHAYDRDGVAPSTKAILPRLHRKFPHYPPWILEGVRIVFTGVIPRGQSAYTHPAWRMAVNMGAVVVDQVDERVTHVVARVDGTDKVRQARKMGGVHVVYLKWLEACASQHRRVDEALFAVHKGTEEGGKGRPRHQPQGEASAPTSAFDEQVAEAQHQHERRRKPHRRTPAAVRVRVRPDDEEDDDEGDEEDDDEGDAENGRAVGDVDLIEVDDDDDDDDDNDEEGGDDAMDAGDYGDDYVDDDDADNVDNESYE
ncbi:hypothetical protein PTSG_03974 [Salpingoeca rosetta]|uniref:protein-serine/threonine phosphatase n=1 Tax=Salpingoeca rosetta (strain ATCC 50818 / BSB-021) TaxID=946362 RepID=F2U7E8_SALR5|nr:uncharacterized protein PTSG_03974 [Salpingoeca rosetta]EGD83365.1 hypothetical protein PTSG_03974 [Salpingoeca rosetta]|eukprot:XP_004994869.1 hypothetical protein PTSG_03974 [Salpingoeca rosetta]